MDFQKFLFTCLTLEWAEKEASGGRKFNLTVHSSTWPPHLPEDDDNVDDDIGDDFPEQINLLLSICLK